MSATFHNIPQHIDDEENPEWMALRAGRVTASEVGPFIINSDKRSLGAREKLICTKLAEICKCEMPPNYPNWAMKRGTQLEPEARALFNLRELGPEMSDGGFFAHDTAALGCSPDGVNMEAKEGLEIKSPVPATHMRFFRDGVLPDEHKFQVHHSLAVTGFKRWHFLSYCPNAPFLHVIVERDAFTDELYAGLLSLNKQLQEAREDLWNKWQQQKEDGK